MTFRKALVSIALLSCALLIAQSGKEDEVSSQEASYDGNTLKLSGNVVLDHAFGLMKAEEAALDKDESNKDHPFSSIHLRKDVVIHPVVSGVLRCEKADFDFNTMSAFFSGSSSKALEFEEEIKEKKKLLFEALEAKMKMTGNQSLKDFSTYHIESIEAIGSSKLTYNNQFIITAPKIIFKKGNQTNRTFEGEVLAVAQGDEPCILTHDQDVIYSSHMQLDVASEKVALANAQGVLKSITSSSEMKFKSDKLIWDENHSELLLQGHVQCQDEILGAYSTDNSLHVIFKDKEVSKIEGQGPAQVALTDQNGVAHQLLCPQAIEVDRALLLIRLEGAQENQIRYTQPLGVLYASHAEIRYKEQEGKIYPSSALLSGQVRLISQDEKKPKVCLAEKMDFSFVEEKVILSSAAGKRVLYWEPVQGITISAPEVHIFKDPKTHKEEVKGIGNVRFSFSDAEKELIKKHYPQFNKSL